MFIVFSFDFFAISFSQVYTRLVFAKDAPQQQALDGQNHLQGDDAFQSFPCHTWISESSSNTRIAL